MTAKFSQIRKRDDRIVKFDPDKITEVIKKAFKATGEVEKIDKTAEKLSHEVIGFLEKKFHERSIPAVEEIQDLVEEALIKNRLVKTAKAYIIYRDQHARMREMEKLVNSDEIMEGYLEKIDWRVKENANMDYSLQGLNNHVASTISSHYWLNKIYPEPIRRAHTEGDFHIHDLQLLACYCCGWDLKDLLTVGFGGVTGKIWSKPAKHLRTALGQIVNFFYTLQGETAGAQALANFDTYLAPFIRYDKLDYKRVKQALQEFLFNMNVPTRVGFQTPFTNITLDLVAPKSVGEEAVIIGGKVMPEKYKDFQPEMDIINEAYVDLMLEGDAMGRVFAWPIPTYNISKEFDWQNANHEKIWEMTAKYGIPYFANFVNSDMDPDDARSMCCRLRLDNRELRKRGGGLFGANPLTGSVGVVTLNMARIGYLSKDKEEFLNRTFALMDIARESLELKRKTLERLTERGLYPYSKFYLRTVHERFGKFWQNHFSTIGLNGLNEACLNLLGKSIVTEEGHKFAEEVLDAMRERLMDYQNETNNLYNLEATPAEGTSFRFAKIDKKKYADIIVANEEACKEKDANPYYTNSSHLPVNYTDDIFEALELQDNLQTKYTGGTVLHGFVGEKLDSGEAVKNLVKKISENYHLPYFTITPTFSICPKHGYLAGEQEYCPECDKEIGFVKKEEESKLAI